MSSVLEDRKSHQKYQAHNEKKPLIIEHPGSYNKKVTVKTPKNMSGNFTPLRIDKKVNRSPGLRNKHYTASKDSSGTSGSPL